jgi:hypothetical protein
MSDSLLTRLSHSSLINSPSLTSTQIQVDSLVGRFSEEASNWRNLAAISAGSLFYRFGRVGTLAAASRAGQAEPLLRFASYGVGLGTEVTAFEMANRSLASLTEGPQNPNLWRWNGQGGIRQGLLGSLITFGSLKGAGALAQGENIFVQHLLQDTGMVLGHNASAAFGMTSRPSGSLAEQFLHAEVTNLQLGAGMALGHSLSGGSLHAIERGLDLSLRSHETERPFLGGLSNRDLSFGLQPAFSRAGIATAEERAPSDDPLQGPQILQMNSFGKGDPPGRRGETSGSLFPPISDTSERTTAEEGSTIEVPGIERAFLIPEEIKLEEGIQEFIENFNYPVAVAYLEEIFSMNLGKLSAVNQAFYSRFGWTAEEALQRSVSYFFPKLSLLKVFPRVRELQKANGGVFKTTALEFRVKDRTSGKTSWLPIQGTGVVRNIYGKDIGFGFLKPVSQGPFEADDLKGDRLLEMFRSTDAENEVHQAPDGALEFHSLMGINLQFMDPQSPLLRLIADQNQRIRITGSMTSVKMIREYSPLLIRSLNSRAEKFQIPVGRSVKVELSSGRTMLTVLRKSSSEGFVIMSEYYPAFSDGRGLEGDGSSLTPSPTPPASSTVRPTGGRSEISTILRDENASPFKKSLAHLGVVIPDPSKKGNKGK